MEVNRIIIWTNPTAPFQKIYVMQNGILVEQIGVKFENTEEIVYALADKYNIFDLHFSGTHGYAEKIAKDIQNNQIIHYGKPNQFHIEYV